MSPIASPQDDPAVVTLPDADPVSSATPLTSLPQNAPPPARRPQFGRKGASSGGLPIPGIVLVAVLIVIAAIVPASPFALSLDPIARTVSQIFFNAPAEARLVILVLLAVFALNIIRLIHAERRLNQERAELEQCRRYIAKCPDPLEESHLAAAMAAASREGALTRAVQGVYDSRLMQTPDLSAITESVTQAEVGRSYQGRNTGNLLMLISLLGTVFGLAGTIATLKPQLTEAQRTGRLEDLLSNLEGTLTTMGTAFASTAWGILLAVLSTALTNRLTRRREDLLADIERFALIELAPRLLPAVQTSMVDDMRRLVEASQRAVAHNQQLVLQVEGTVQAATKDLHRALTEAGGFVVEAGRASLDVANQLDRILGQFPADLENALGSLLDSVDELKLTSTQVTRTYAGLSDSVRQLEVALTEQRQGIEATISEQRAQTDSLIQGQEHWLVTQRAVMEQQTRDLANALTSQADALQRHVDATAREVASLVERMDPKLPTRKDWQDLHRVLEQGRAIAPVDMDRLATTVGQSIRDSIGQAKDSRGGDISALQQQTREISRTLLAIADSLEAIRLSATTHVSGNGRQEEIR